MAFLTVNWLSIVVAAVVSWVFGAMYYGALGQQWVAAQGKTMEQFRTEQAAKVGKLSAQTPFILALIAQLVMAWALYGILAHMKLFTLRAGIISGLLIWFGFVLTTLAVNYSFSGRKPMLIAIDGGYWLGVMAIIGAIVGWMGP
jgi:hypothetical protein